MKVKDLPPNTNLGKIKVRTPDGFEGWWVSQWQKGVFLRKERIDKQVHPQLVENLKETLEWEVIDSDIGSGCWLPGEHCCKDPLDCTFRT